MYIIAAWTVKEKRIDERGNTRRPKQEEAGKKGTQENWEIRKEIEKWGIR